MKTPSSRFIFRLIGKASKIPIFGILLVFLLSASALSLTLGCSNSSSSVTQGMGQQISTATLPKIEVKTESITQSVPFTCSNENDASLPQGQTKVKQAGVNGTKQITYQVTYTNGVETSRQKTSETVTVNPVNQIVSVGTYVAPPPASSSGGGSGGGYQNSDGNYVPSPGSNPAGATARCNDGTYSYSQHRQGTCSHHGGVAAWL